MDVFIHNGGLKILKNFRFEIQKFKNKTPEPK
jgi:hypothetical protein